MKPYLLPAFAFTAGLVIISHSMLLAQALNPESTAGSTGSQLEDAVSQTDDDKTSYNPNMPTVSDADVMNTMYPDPLSKSFKRKNNLSDEERNKSVKDLLREFEKKAAKIASETEIPEFIEDVIPDEYENNEEEPQGETSSDSDDLTDADEPGDTEEDNPEIQNQTEPDAVSDSESEAVEGNEEEVEVEETEEIIENEKDGSEQKENKEPQLPKFTKNEPLPPALLEHSDPALMKSESEEKVTLTGVIIPEIHNVTKRKHMFRWVLKDEKGALIPLRSNLTLMSKVTDEELLDSEATLTGYFQSSKINSKIKFFIVESIEKGRSKSTEK